MKHKRLPNFFVVGAAKSGTTALWKYFQQHPDIYVTQSINNKELGYYSNQYGIKEKSSYLSYFKDAQPNQIIGEVCHVYLSSKESAAWIKQDVPDARIIIMLRNPIERAYSLYHWMVMNGYENEPTFEKALKKEENILKGSYNLSKLTHNFKHNYYYFNSGLYSQQVENYYNIFGKRNVFVIEYTEFQTNQKGCLEEVFKFLNVSPLVDIQLNQVNKSKRVYSVTMQYWLKHLMISRFRKNKKVKRILKKIINKNIVESPPKTMKIETYNRFKEKYKVDINELTKLTAIDFNEKWLS